MSNMKVNTKDEFREWISTWTELTLDQKERIDNFSNGLIQILDSTKLTKKETNGVAEEFFKTLLNPKKEEN